MNQLRRGYERDENKDDGILTNKSRILAGRVNADGDIFPANEPVLWKKENILLSQTTTNPTVVIADLSTWLGIDAAANLKDFRLDVFFELDVTSDAVLTDDFALYGYDGSNNTYSVLVDDAGYAEPTRGTIPGVTDPVVFFPKTGVCTGIYADAIDWAAAETHKYHITVLAYRMPSAVCEA